MTGRYDIHTGLHTVIFPDEPIGLPVVHPTMADKLREAGYATHIVGKWHLGFFEKKYFPTRRGFDSFFGFLSGHSRYFNHVTSWRNMSGYDLREGEEPANMSMYNNYYSTDLFADKAIDLIQKHDTNKPLFLYLPFQSPHQPFEVPKKYEDLYSNIGNKFRRTYAGMVSCMDEAVGRVLHAMKRRNMWENTILVFTTDNGGDMEGSSNYPLRGRKGSLWEGGIRAVGFVHSPLLDKGVVGSASRELLHVTDWFPTLVNIAGGNLSNIKPIDGVNQWETIRSGSVSKRNEILHDVDPDIRVGGRPMYSDTFDTRYRGAVRVGDWKLLTGYPGKEFEPPIRSPGANTSLLSGHEHIKLFNIAEDPTELVDLSHKHPVLVRQLLHRLEYYYNGRIPFMYEKGTERLNPKNLGGFWGPWN